LNRKIPGYHRQPFWWDLWWKWEPFLNCKRNIFIFISSLVIVKCLVAAAKSPFFIEHTDQTLLTGIFMDCLCCNVASDFNFQMSMQPPSPAEITKSLPSGSFCRRLILNFLDDFSYKNSSIVVIRVNEVIMLRQEAT
jgi:hypothetical protein